ncbi:hypothetical protein MKX01_041282 [Papaver californicum]|nr:hypothetical protein MKX01_041282 [Papaver californicum]
MEGEETTPTTCIIGFSPPPPPHLDGVEEEEILTAGSPTDDLGIHEEEVEEPAARTVLDNSSSSTLENIALTDELRDKIIRQVEYYFSDENLPTDKFLMKFLKKNKHGFIPVGVIASFRKMKKLIQNNELVVAALRESSLLVVSSDGKKVKRARPLPVIDVKEAQSRTVVVENLPANQSTENLQKIFGDAGNIKSICIRDPHDIESTKSTKAETTVSGKMHALIEYETVEAAVEAVSTLNDEKNWRSGMRVEILLSRMSKYGLPKRSGKGLEHPDKNNDAQVSAKAGDEQNRSSHDHHNEQPGGQEEEKHLPSEKQGRKSCNRGRHKAHKQHNGSGYGHGHGYAHSATGTQGLSVNKPPPGPKMPDGTKGFTTGRGQPMVG